MGEASQSYTYTAAGTYTAQLTVSDENGASDSATLVIVVSPEALVQVPDVQDLPQAQAENAITAAGLAVGTVTFQNSASVASGNVISQTPGAGAWAAPATAVDLVISLGPATNTVPNLVGLSQTAAVEEILAAGLSTGTITSAESDSVDYGAVISQDPAGGTETGPGAAVNLMVSSGTADTILAEPAASAVDLSVATSLPDNVAFLYAGPDPVQVGMDPETIEAKRVAVLRGKVFTRGGAPLPGVKISVLNRAEYGATRSRENGQFDMVVNGGALTTVQYEKTGYLVAQRQVRVPWRDYVWLPDVVLIAADAAVDIDFSGPMGVARGSVVTDDNGTRQANLLFPQGVSAEMVLPNGTTQALSLSAVRATEFTVGANGPETMPGMLPPTSAYTYALEYSIDAAMAAGATRVTFSSPLYHYVENFIGFDVGSIVPTGYYDRQIGQWVPSQNGRVIQLVGISEGRAQLDIDGDTVVDDATTLATLGITDAELQQLAILYDNPGLSLWRVPIPHFTPYDCNWPYSPPGGAGGPGGGGPPRNGGEEEEDPCEDDGRCVIEFQNRIMKERIPIAGTPWALTYRSDRVAGFSAARALYISLSDDTYPTPLKRIELEISVAGRIFKESFAPAVNLEYEFIWDGLDAYGRRVQGVQPAVIRIGYVYDGVYQAPPDVENAFGGFPLEDLEWNDTPTLDEVIFWQELEAQIGAWEVIEQGLGGWGIDVHHTYSTLDKTLYLGDGTQKQGQALAPVIDTLAGGGSYYEDYGDGVPATEVAMYPDCLEIDAAGNVYVMENERLNRIDTNGMITTIAGQRSTFGFEGDGGPASQALFDRVNGMDIAPDGSIFLADTRNHRIRKIDPDGIINTVAGNGTAGFLGDGGPAKDAELYSPVDVAVGPAGGFYIAQATYPRVRYVAPNGIITTVAGGDAPFGTVGEGEPAVDAYVSPQGIDVGPDGCLYILNYTHRLQKVSLDGILTTVAGTGSPGDTGDGGPATAATIYTGTNNHKIHVATDGSIYLPQAAYYHRLRWIDPQGIIHTIAGNGESSTTGDLGDGGLAAAATTYNPEDVTLDPDGRIYLMTYRRIRIIEKRSPAISAGDFLFPSDNGKEIYVFSRTGRHLRTLDSRTGALIYTFAYNDQGHLVAIIDAFDNATTIERHGSGEPAAIISPYGQRTEIMLDAEGYLQTVTGPMGGAWSMVYDSGGLLTDFTDPNDAATLYAYEPDGFLRRDDDPEGGHVELTREDLADGFQVPVVTAENRTDTYRVETLADGTVRRTTTFADGTQNILETGPDGTALAFSADGMVRSTIYGPDTRFGMLAPFVAAYTETTPNGLALTYSQSRSATFGDPVDLLAPTSITAAQNLNGHSFTTQFSSIDRTLTRTTPEGRQLLTVLNDRARPVEYRLTGLAPLLLTYDALGRMQHIQHGTGDTARTYTVAYNASGYVDTITNPLGLSLNFATDLLGRFTGVTLPGGDQILYSYDGRDKLLSLTPPDRPAHVFTYNSVNRLESYDPPDAAGSTSPTTFGYNLDRQLTAVSLAGDRTVDYAYENGGRLETTTYSQGTRQYQYDPDSGKLTQVTTPEGTYTAEYDGKLITAMIWSGSVAGRVDLTYDNFFRVSSVSVNSADAVERVYDGDGLLVQSGELAIERSSANGLITGTSVGSITDTYTYNEFGDLTGYSYAFGGVAQMNVALARDKLGRIIEKQVTEDPDVTVYTYDYDENGRLSTSTMDSTQPVVYTYDANGNRLSYTESGSPAVASAYDDQDRLTSRGPVTYEYLAEGARMTRTEGSAVTEFSYDELGNLLSVTLPDATTISYVIDGRNRRIGKKINGTLVKGFLYLNKLQIIAELDGSGTVISRFVYGTRSNVPDLMVRNGNTYRIVSDPVGSPILILDTTSGEVMQKIEYDAFGKPAFLVGSPDFQPFGFAGGLYDPDTGLIRFGSRDYDPETGSFTAKDPVLFNGGTSNLYTYLGNDPINRVDPGGMGSSSDCDDDEGDCNGRNNRRRDGDDDQIRFRVEASWRESAISISIPSWADSVIGLVGAVLGTSNTVALATELGALGSALGVVTYPIAFEGARQTADQLAESLVEDRVNSQLERIDEIWRDVNRGSQDNPSDDCP